MSQWKRSVRLVDLMRFITFDFFTVLLSLFFVFSHLYSNDHRAPSRCPASLCTRLLYLISYGFRWNIGRWLNEEACRREFISFILCVGECGEVCIISVFVGICMLLRILFTNVKCIMKGCTNCILLIYTQYIQTRFRDYNCSITTGFRDIWSIRFFRYPENKVKKILYQFYLEKNIPLLFLFNIYFGSSFHNFFLFKI